MSRADALLAELSARHGNCDAGFLLAVRPLVDRILAPGLAAASRCSLLELLAETFERDLRIRRDGQQARTAWRDFLAGLQRRFAAG